MGRARVDLRHALALERAGDLDQGPAGVDLVVDDDGSLAADVADDVHHLRAVEVAVASLLDDGQRRVDELRELPRALREPEVGHDDEVLELHVDEVPAEHVDRREAVDRDHVRDEASRDRNPRLVLLVRAPVRVVRDDGRDPSGGRPLERVDHDQELHDRLVHGARRRLDEEDVLLADVVQDAHEDVLVRELEDFGPTGLAGEPVRDLARQLRVGVAVVDLVLVYVHACLPVAEGGHDERSPPSAGAAPSASGSPLSPMAPRSASPSWKAEIATTLSPSPSRMTMTPRAPEE